MTAKYTRNESPAVAETDEPRISSRILAAINTTIERSKTLLDEGYLVQPLRPFQGIYFVRRPEPLVIKKTGEVVEGYVVDVINGTCECEQFHRSAMATGDGVCKHIIAARAKVRDAMQTLGLLPMEEVPAPATRWQVVEEDPFLGELPGLDFATQEEAES